MVQGVFILCYIWLNLIVRVKSKTTITYPSVVPVYLKSGGNLNLLCQQSEGFRVIWSKAEVAGPDTEYKIIDSTKDTGFVTLAHVDGIYFLRLTKSNVSPSDSGSYKCSVQSGTDLPYAVDVHILRVESQSGFVTHSGNLTSVGCSLVDSDIRATIRWFRSDIELASSSPTSLSALSSSSSPFKYQLNSTFTDSLTSSLLTIKNVGEADVGEYVCMFELNNEYQFNHSVFMHSHPQIKPMGRSKNLAEGKTLDLNCKAWGWPAPNVSWTREPEDYSAPSSSSSSSSDPFWLDKRISFPTNTSLRIDPVAVTDRAIYVCHATSVMNDTIVITTTSSILVRVRGKFAPLLPLAGIIVEIIILCVIIYFYERRKAREREAQERKEVAGNQFNSIAQEHRRSSSADGGTRQKKHR